MSTLIDGLLFGWSKNLGYGQNLIADLSDDQMALQPGAENGPGMNHPAWVFAHLNLYLPCLESLIKGETFDDPKDHEFGMQSSPQADRSIYPSKEQLLNDFVSGHEAVAAALRSGGDAVLDQAMTLERWQTPMPTVGQALPYLMLVHENTHFGQVSAWRRVQGLPAV